MDRMIFFFLIAATLLAISLASAVISGEVNDSFVNSITQVVPEENDEHFLSAEHHFSLFKSKYEKTYATQEEHDHRLRVFKANLRRARRHQLLDPSAVHGVTQFSDLTPKEFRRHFLGLKRPKYFRLSTDTQTAQILPTSDLPTDFDWRDQGAVTPVKNQGLCGSCWSFSATGALEGAHFLATKELVSLSKQQLLDCDHECDPADAKSCDSGCNGGLMNNAFEYARKAGGLMKEEDYPYRGFHSACKFKKSMIAASVSNFSVIPADEDQIAANLVKHGPLAFAINSLWMQTYIGGVSCPYVCSKSQDHGVLLVGFGSAGFAPISFKEMPYWIVKNSWGSLWGEHGYYKICRGRPNMCGMDTMVSAVAAVHTSMK